jgi:hypothetical protein
MDPRSFTEPTLTKLAELDLLVGEDDADDPYLTPALPEDPTRDSEDFDERILAGLVTF